MSRHKDSPLVGAPGPGRADGRGGAPRLTLTPGQVLPRNNRSAYHSRTATIVDGVWRPRQPALFATHEVFDCPVPVFGRLPKGFLTRIALPMLMAPRQDVLHVCSGSLREKWTVDIRPEVRPRVVADGRALPFRDGQFPAVLLDPPYVPAWARQYGTKYPPTYPLLQEAARVTAGGGRIGILHFLVCFPPKGTRLVKVTGISVGMGYQMRAFTVFEREKGVGSR